VAYPERALSDLIDEEKRYFSARRVLSTFLGGFRLKYDEVQAKNIHWSLIIF
jgi:hypothetical protein